MWDNQICLDDEISIFGRHRILADIYTGLGVQRNRPCILFLHGGGFIGGDKRQFSGMAAYLSLSIDAVCVSINYRTAPGALFPSPVIDCLGTYQWLLNHKADLKIGDFYLAGGSPGASIAFLAMVNGKKILADAGLPLLDQWPTRGLFLNPILDLDVFYKENPAEQNSVNQYLGRESSELRKKASPLSYPQAGLSFLVLQGTMDHIVGNNPLKRMEKEFVQAGSRVFVKKYDKEPHGWFNQPDKMPSVAHTVAEYICNEEGRDRDGIGQSGSVV